MRHVQRLAVSIALLALSPGLSAQLTPAGLVDDLRARRARVMDKLGADALLVLWSAPPARYSADVDYEYRQDSNLYYLTGVEQEDTILVLMPGNASRREILFVRERNPVREHWTGHRLTASEATAATGIETVFTANQ